MKFLKKFLKIILIVVLSIVLVIGGWWVYIKYIADYEQSEALTIIPKDAVFALETSDLSEAWTEISNSDVWNYLIKNPFFKDMNEDFESLNSYLKNSKVASFILHDRDIIMSAHVHSNKDWDFIFIVDLGEVAATLDGGLKPALGFIDGYTIKDIEHKGTRILEMLNNKDAKDKTFMTIINNLLVVSFNGSLLERTIDNKDSKNWKDNTKFTEVTKALGVKKLFRLYFNYPELNNFSRVFIKEDSDIAKMLGGSLNFSILDASIDDKMLTFQGHTGVDSVSSYVRALADVSPGRMSAWKILSDQAALYFSMTFDEYQAFYNNLINQYKEGNTEDMESIEKNVHLAEKYLGIKLQEHIFDWIGSEIAFAKLRPSSKTRMEDVLIFIHSKDIDKTKESMAYVLKKIKRRTPMKFKPYKFKNFDIYSTKMKWFFKIFFGKMFGEMEKPYFTFIEDFMVLSNSEETLKRQISDYITSNTLKLKPHFSDFVAEFNSKSNITLFIRSPKMYENLYFYSNVDDKKSVQENKEFILSFARIGFQLTSDNNNLFETVMKAEHDPEALNTDQLEKVEKEITESDVRVEIDSMSFVVILPPEAMEKDSLYTEYFEDNSTIRIEGGVKNQMPEGLWKTYYSSGNIRLTANYIEGKVDGDVIFYFDTNEHIVQGEMKFDEGEAKGYFYEYYPNSTRKAKIEYDDGLANGVAEYYHKNGNLKIKAEFKKGLKDDKWIFYDTKGNVVGKQKWRKGVLKE